MNSLTNPMLVSCTANSTLPLRGHLTGQFQTIVLVLLFSLSAFDGSAVGEQLGDRTIESDLADESTASRGTRRKLSEIRFRGLETLSTQDLIQALRTTPEVYEAMYPSIDEAVYRSLVVDAVRRGMVASGFHDATVRLDEPPSKTDISVIEVPTAESVVTRRSHPFSITITEGPRYRFGTLKVNGGNSEVNHWLQTQLTQHIVRDPDKKPEDYELTWRSDRQCPGHPVAMENVTNRIRDALSDLNVAFDHVTVNYNVDREDSRVNGVVTIPNTIRVTRLGDVKLLGVNHAVLDHQLRSSVKMSLRDPLDLKSAYAQVETFLQDEWVRECDLRIEFPETGSANVVYELETFEYVEDDNHSELSTILNHVYDKQLRGSLSNIKIVNSSSDVMRYTVVLTDFGAAIDVTPMTEQRSYSLRAMDDLLFLKSNYRDLSESTSLRLPQILLKLGIVQGRPDATAPNEKDPSDRPKHQTRIDGSFHWNEHRKGGYDLSVRVTKGAWRDLFPPDQSNLVREKNRILIRHRNRTLTLDNDKNLTAFYDKVTGVRAFFGDEVRTEGERLRRQAVEESGSMPPMFVVGHDTPPEAVNKNKLKDNFFVPALSGSIDYSAKLWLGIAYSDSLIRPGSMVHDLMGAYALAVTGRTSTLEDRLNEIAGENLRGPITNIAAGEIALRGGLFQRATNHFTLARELAIRPNTVSDELNRLIDNVIPLELFAQNFDVRAALGFGVSAGMQRGSDSTRIARVLIESLPDAESEAQRRRNFVRASTYGWTLLYPKITRYCDQRLAAVATEAARKARSQKRSDDKTKRKAQEQTDVETAK